MLMTKRIITLQRMVPARTLNPAAPKAFKSHYGFDARACMPQERETPMSNLSRCRAAIREARAAVHQKMDEIES
jgi:hypothetical protein